MTRWAPLEGVGEEWPTNVQPTPTFAIGDSVV